MAIPTAVICIVMVWFPYDKLSLIVGEGQIFGREKDYVVKFTSKVIRELNVKGITLNTLLADMEQLKLDNLYETFYFATKDMNNFKSIDEALEVVDQFYEDSEDNDIEKFFMIILEEYANAMGLGKKFKEVMAQQKKKK